MKPTKKLNGLFTDDRAISPVVGVALLIAITVILAAVIGAVVLGIGTGPTETPQAQLTAEVDADAGEVTIEHDGGDPLENVVVKDANDGSEELNLRAGESKTVTGLTINEGEEVSVVWQDPESDSETELAEFEA